MTWQDLEVLRQVAQKAAMLSEPMILTAAEVLGLLDAVDSAQDEAEGAEDESSTLAEELDASRGENEDLKEQILELEQELQAVVAGVQ